MSEFIVSLIGIGILTVYEALGNIFRRKFQKSKELFYNNTSYDTPQFAGGIVFPYLLIYTVIVGDLICGTNSFVP